jgi:hypothetical protein
MIDLRNAPGCSHAVDVLLKVHGGRSPILRHADARDAEAVYVDRLAVQTVGDFLTRQYNELAGAAERGVQRLDRRKELVVCDEEEVITVVAVPFDRRFGGRIAVAVPGMRMASGRRSTNGYAFSQSIVFPGITSFGGLPI